ncbi:hypothetical protein ACN6K4_002126, partial [Streptomyces hayashii]
RAGIGDAVSNISAIADWELANRVKGEKIDGLAGGRLEPGYILKSGALCLKCPALRRLTRTFPLFSLTLAELAASLRRRVNGRACCPAHLVRGD